MVSLEGSNVEAPGLRYQSNIEDNDQNIISNIITFDFNEELMICSPSDVLIIEFVAGIMFECDLIVELSSFSFVDFNTCSLMNGTKDTHHNNSIGGLVVKLAVAIRDSSSQ